MLDRLHKFPFKPPPASLPALALWLDNFEPRKVVAGLLRLRLDD
jgi:hypothetical protein